MKEYNIRVNFMDGTIDTDNFMELVENDYNSTKLNFTFDTTNRVVLKMLYPDNTVAYVDDIVDNMFVFPPGLLSQDGEYQIELASYDGDGRLTDYETMSFYVRPELVSTDEIVEPDDRVPILDELINEVEQLNIDANKSGTTTTVEISKKDGTTKVVEILDGTNGEDGVTPDIGINGNWYIGDVDTGKPSRGEQGLQGEPGPAGRDGYIQYTAGENITIDENNVISAEDSDLTDYVKNTDYASSSKGGVIKTGGSYALSINNSGNLYPTVVTYASYPSLSNYAFIGKGTLENVITGKDLADKTYVDGITGALSNLTTTDKTNLVSAINEVASGSGVEQVIPLLEVPTNFSSTSSTTDATTLAQASKIVNDFYNDSKMYMQVVVSSTWNGGFSFIAYGGKFTDQETAYRLYGMPVSSSYFGLGYGISISGTWTNNIFSCNRVYWYKGTVNVLGDYLSKTNTSSYTPTGDYNPATKKYVDDAIASKIWIGTQAEYDALTTHDENTVYFIKEDTNVSA